MGKSTPSAPAPVDPTTIINAATNASHVDQSGPNGSLTWSQQPNGQWLQSTSLSPVGGAILGQSQAAAQEGITGLRNANGSLKTNVSAPTLQMGVTNPGVPVTSLANAGSINGTVAPSGTIGTSVPGAGAIQGSLANSGNIQGTLANSGNIQGQVKNAGGIQSTLGNAGSLTTNVNGTPIQGQLNTSGISAIPQADDAAYQKAVQSVYGQDTSRLDPQWAQQQTELETQLAGQGVAQNSDAWNKAMTQFTQGKNDAYTSAMNNAVTQGSQLEQSLFGMGLQANQAGEANALNAGNFANAAQGQGFNEGQANASLNNAAQGQQYGENLSSGQFANSAQNQQYGQNLNNAQFANSAQNQQYNQNLGAGQFADAAQNQQYNQNLGAGQFANASQQQQYGQNLSDTQLANAAQAQQYGQNSNDTQLGLAAQQQQFNQNQASGTFANSAASQELQQALATAGFGNNAQQTLFGDDMTDANFHNAAVGQGVQTDLAETGLPNQAMGTGLGGTPASPDVLGAYSLNAQQQMAQYQSQMQSQSAKKGGTGSLLGTLGGAALLSDRRIKRDIKRIGRAPNGLPIYSFRYAWDAKDKRHIGLMAQDVETKNPNAVITRGGLKHVDYGKALAA